MKIETYLELSKTLSTAKMCFERLPNEEINKEMLGPFLSLIQTSESAFEEERIRREKQRIGIQNAHQNGIHSGRPAMSCSKKFLEIASLQLQRKIMSKDAAEKLGISLSTYYGMRMKYRKKIEEWQKQESLHTKDTKYQ